MIRINRFIESLGIYCGNIDEDRERLALLDPSAYITATKISQALTISQDPISGLGNLRNIENESIL